MVPRRLKFANGVQQPVTRERRQDEFARQKSNEALPQTDDACGLRGSRMTGWAGFLRLSLLKTVNYRESLGIFLCDRRTVGRHDHHSICSRFHAFIPVFAAERRWNSSLSLCDVS
jgi:hypothetical protein